MFSTNATRHRTLISIRTTQIIINWLDNNLYQFHLAPHTRFPISHKYKRTEVPYEENTDFGFDQNLNGYLAFMSTADNLPQKVILECFYPVCVCVCVCTRL